MAQSQANMFLIAHRFGGYLRLAFAFLILVGFLGSFVTAQPASCTAPGATAPTCGTTTSGTPSCASVQNGKCPVVNAAICPTGQYACVPFTYPICSIYNTIHTAIFILGLALLILGAALYAAGNIAPGNLKGTIQGYGLGMITGGVVGVIIAVIAPYLLTVISGQANIAAQCSVTTVT